MMRQLSSNQMAREAGKGLGRLLMGGTGDQVCCPHMSPFAAKLSPTLKAGWSWMALPVCLVIIQRSAGMPCFSFSWSLLLWQAGPGLFLWQQY